MFGMSDSSPDIDIGLSLGGVTLWLFLNLVLPAMAVVSLSPLMCGQVALGPTFPCSHFHDDRRDQNSETSTGICVLIKFCCLLRNIPRAL